MERRDEPARARHEATDADSRLLAKLGLWLVGLVVVVLIVMWGLYGLVIDREARRESPRSPLAESREPFVGPRLFLTPSESLEDVRAAEEEILTTYGWIDADEGWVRIPVERAIELMAERGLPSTPDADEEAATGSP